VTLVLYIDDRHRFVGHAVVAVGWVQAARLSAHPVLLGAQACRATGSVLVRYRRYGALCATEAEQASFRAIAAACGRQGLAVVDHLVVVQLRRVLLDLRTHTLIRWMLALGQAVSYHGLMAKLDDLIAQVGDTRLRRQLEEAAVELRRRKKFGLVYEQHIPETTTFPSETIQKGSVVMIRTEPSNKTRYVVDSVTRTKASISAGEEAWTIPFADLLVVKPFGEPVYPVLKPFGDSVIRDPDKPFHMVINGENFHALQLLLFGYEGKVDCIYIDPPYNTGARDWKYNNDFVDANDGWRNSKWLSMMDRRLLLARRLLAPDGVLIVTIDEHEVAHLGVLLEEVFPEARRQMVTIVNNAAGVSQGGFWRVDEYAFFCWMGSARPNPVPDDLLSDETKSKQTVIWFSLVRAGGVNATPARRPNLVFPIAIDPATNRVVGVGRTLKERCDAGEVKGDLNAWRPDPTEQLQEFPVVWPFNPDGSLYTWQMNPKGVMATAKSGFIRVRRYDGAGGNQFSLSYVRTGHQKRVLSGEIPNRGREGGDGPYIIGAIGLPQIPKTVWKRSRHDAGKWGSRTLRELLGDVSFDYAKSPYAVLDTLRTAVGNKPGALILDFFAGSGTTLHSVAMLNAEDGGTRRCVLVTNNQVDAPLAARLNDEGLFLGDDEFEERGIARAVTIPRVRAALTGRRGGTRIEGEYQGGRNMADGFTENACFFDLAYTDPDAIDVGGKFDDILPALWMAAGCNGNPAELTHDAAWLLSTKSRFAVLLDEDRFRSFRSELNKHPDISHVWLVTDSETAFARMRDGIAGSRTVGMLYRDYLRNFRVNVDMSAGAASLL
jgi:adenine-specific DNA-methyltransferase